MQIEKMPAEVRQIFNEVMSLEIKPVNSEAGRHFEQHGKEFEMDAIRAVLSKRQRRRYIGLWCSLWR